MKHYCAGCNQSKEKVDQEDIRWGVCDICHKETAVVRVQGISEMPDIFKNIFKGFSNEK